MPTIPFAQWHERYNPGSQRKAAAHFGVSLRHYQELLRGARFSDNQPLHPSRLERLAMLAIQHGLDAQLDEFG